MAAPFNLSLPVAFGFMLTSLGAPAPVAQGGLLALAAAVLTFAAVLESRRHRQLRHDLDTLSRVVGELPDLVERPNPNGFGPLTSGLAASVAQIWTTLNANRRVVELEREELVDALARTEARLRDPLVEARRARIASLRGVHGEAAVGPSFASVRLVDLWLDHAVIAIGAALDSRLVPGMPISLCIETDDGFLNPVAVVAVAPTAALPSGEVEWTVRFGKRLDVDMLPPELWRAMSMRMTGRVLPSPDVPVTATLLTLFGDVPALVVDLSETGIGLLVELMPQQLGDLHDGLIARIMFPTLGRMAVLPVLLRSVVVTATGARLGLSFSDESGIEHEKLATWLAQRISPRPQDRDQNTTTEPWLDACDLSTVP